MRFVKHVIATDIQKPYAVCTFDGNAGKGFVVAAEKRGPIRLYATDGTALCDIDSGETGVMTLLQTPDRTDQLLATHRFFSPNFGGDDAQIVAYTRSPAGTWDRTLVCDLPYVHRFGVLAGTDGTRWLMACTIKGACRPVRDDWSVPGAVYAAPLPDRLEVLGDKPLQLTCIANCQPQNHGFWVAPNRGYALVGTAAGVFRCDPPPCPSGTWQIRCLLIGSTSDMCAIDLDGDGKQEIVSFSPFHGQSLVVWHEGTTQDRFERVWTDPVARPCLHAIRPCAMGDKPCVLVGHRQGKGDLLYLTFDDGEYRMDLIDHGCGPASCTAFADSRGQQILAANRETDEVALYNVEA